MKKRNIILIVLLLIIYLYNTFFIKEFITGKYVAEISDPFGSFGVKNGDKLELFCDNSVLSDTWGKGTYKLEHSLKGTKIIFDYENQGIHTYFYRDFFIGETKIAIFTDLNSAYKKID